MSFSSKNHPFIRRLLARLSDQGLNPWDYSAEGQEIPAGKAIAHALVEKIAQADLFLPVVSSQSCSSRHCRDEIKHALDRLQHAPLVIVPLVDAVVAQKKWPAEYNRLQRLGLRYCLVHLEEPLQVEGPLQEICQQINTPYHPPLNEVENFPFMLRLHQELKDKIPNRKGREGRENSVFRQLMSAQNEFVKAMKGRSFDKASEYVEHIIQTCKFEFPDTHFYFPYIAKAVCQISCGRLDEAEATLVPLLHSPLLDENVFGALGHIRSRQGRYREAMQAYQEAFRRDPHDLAALYGEVMNALFCGETRDYEIMRARIESLSPDEKYPHHKLKALLALLLITKGRHEEAERLFHEITDRPEAMVGAVVHWAESLVRQGKAGEALTMLDGFWDRLNHDAAYLEEVALVAHSVKNLERSLQVLDILAARYPTNRRHVASKAAVLWYLGRRESARALAEQVLDNRRYPPPRTQQDFYYNGLANWFLKRRDRANYDFDFSGKAQNHHYSCMFPNGAPAKSTKSRVARRR